MKKKPHGGARKGAGRKKGFRMKPEKKKEPTVVMRIPKSMVEAVKKLLRKK
jgi:hypothetical protein